MCDRDCNPEGLSRAALLAFIDNGLTSYLAGQGEAADPRVARKLRRTMERYDPNHPTPYEFMERLSLASR